MWDLEPVHPISGERMRKIRKHKGKRREVTESDLSSSSERLLKTTSDFMLAGAGIAVISGLGSQVISAVSKK